MVKNGVPSEVPINDSRRASRYTTKAMPHMLRDVVIDTVTTDKLIDNPPRLM